MISTRTSRIALAFVAAAFVSTAAPAFASDPKAPKTQEAKSSEETLYCVKSVTTGTLIPRKTCKTRDQWIKEFNFDPLTVKKN